MTKEINELKQVKPTFFSGEIYESDFDNHSVMVPLLMSYHLYLTDNMAVQPFVGPYVEYGFDDYLAKPIEPSQIREQVERYLHI